MFHSCAYTRVIYLNIRPRTNWKLVDTSFQAGIGYIKWSSHYIWNVFWLFIMTSFPLPFSPCICSSRELNVRDRSLTWECGPWLKCWSVEWQSGSVCLSLITAQRSSGVSPQKGQFGSLTLPNLSFSGYLILLVKDVPSS